MGPSGLPRDAGERARVLEHTGRRIYRALRQGRPAALLVDDEDLRAVLSPAAADRYEAVRAVTRDRLTRDRDRFLPFRQARYQGICLLNSRLEPPRSPVGLVAEAWVFDRALVMGREASGRRFAAWVEGTFVHTSRGFLAIDLARVETPRWEHSDLELTTCDMELGIHDPHI
jgi:hypothetical protein